MPLPEFNKVTQNTTAVPEWAQFMKEGEFISYSVSYETKKYFDKFDRYVFESPETGDIVYYVYDPVKQGADRGGKYPVLMWLHGMSNALDGEKCIMCCGAEQYASEKYQGDMGGAYIVVPLANEKREPDGNISGSWSGETDYAPALKRLYDCITEKYGDNIVCKFVMGASSGGYMTWRLLENDPGYFDGAIPISSGYMPERAALERISAGGTHLLVAHGRHDEMAAFDKCVRPAEDVLMSFKNCICFFPEWVYNGDGGISSVNYGFEMGQHCMINWVQTNLIFNSGVPADGRLPGGVTGWIREVCREKGIFADR